MEIDLDELAYTSTPDDRAAASRSDPEWVSAQLSRPDLQVLPFSQDQCLLIDGAPVVAVGGVGRALLATGSHVLLGLADDGAPVVAVDVRGSRQKALAVAGADGAADLRSLVGSLPRPTAARLAYARGLLHWNRNARFCGACGSATEVRQAGHARACTGPACGRLHFPRIEPAVIALVESPDPAPRLLLARHHGAGPDGWALLAGFLEIGESLEGAVRREVGEEAGVAVGPVEYLGSQGWPFPSGVMIGFRATALDSAIDVDGQELLDARWFTRAEVAARIDGAAGAGPVDSIGGHLLRGWVAASSPSP